VQRGAHRCGDVRGQRGLGDPAGDRGVRDAMAWLVAADSAQSASRVSAAPKSVARPGPGMGISNPVRWASTANSVHKVMRRSRVAAFSAAHLPQSGRRGVVVSRMVISGHAPGGGDNALAASTRCASWSTAARREAW
jgi:hypothetical protein